MERGHCNIAGAPGRNGTGLVSALKKSSDDYLIHPMDVLEVSIYGEEDLVRKLVVRPDGKISFPLIGDIQVAGFVVEQADERNN